jgi:hypothetical protein
LPNNNRPFDVNLLRNIPCSCVPCKHYEVSLDHGPCVSCRDHAKFEEKDFDPVKERDAAYDLGYKDAQKTKGYYGHENGCDCAVCDDIAMRKSLQTIADAEFNKLLDDNASLLAHCKELEEINQRLEAEWSLKAVEQFNRADRYKNALQEIIHAGNSDSNFPQDSRMYDIAKAALERG